METTEQNKIKTFLPYMGQMVTIPEDYRFDGYRTDAKMGEITGICGDFIKINDISGFYPYWNFKLVLKPLSAITDQDAIEMAKLFGGVDGKIILNRPEELNNKDIHFTVQVYTNEPEFTSYSTPKYWKDSYGMDAYQWLQSKGYDLPSFYLGGKTLRESGLAIYESEIKK